MKNKIMLLLCSLLISNVAFSQKPKVVIGTGVGSNNFRVPYHQNYNKTLYADTIYILTGWYFIDSTYSLTIQPGTLIRGDSASAGTLLLLVVVQKYLQMALLMHLLCLQAINLPVNVIPVIGVML